MAYDCCCWCEDNVGNTYSPFGGDPDPQDCDYGDASCGCLNCIGDTCETCGVFDVPDCYDSCNYVCTTTGGSYLASFCQEPLGCSGQPIGTICGCMEWNCFNYNPNATFQTSCYGCCYDQFGNPWDGCGFTPSPSPGKGPPRKPISMGIAKKGGRVNTTSRFSGRTQNNSKGKAKRRFNK